MKKWNILSVYKLDQDILDQILTNRGFTTNEEKKAFLNPPSITELVKELPEELKKSLLTAKKIISECIKKNIPIVVHGDYDADGISSAAIVYNTIHDELGYSNVHYFIPSRFEDGYGLSVSSVDAVRKNLNEAGISLTNGLLFITVDSGITAVDEVDYINKLGFKVIITDHHQKPDKLPNAELIVWNDKLVGAGIAWILSRVIGSKNTQDIALAALATVTDLQPLLGLNRVIVKKGLEVINTNPLPGLKKIIEVAGKGENEITTYDLGWMIGPRINASGRLIEASDSLKLFIEKEETVLGEIAQKLNEINTLRQDKTLEMFEMASGVDETNLPKIIFTMDENYHEGIIGLVASKLVQKYYRPSIVISLSDGYGKGSVRSINGVDIIALLREFDDKFESLGGHPMAAGFTIERAKIPELQSSLLELFDVRFPDITFIRELNVDMEIPIELVGIELLDKLEKMKPFGIGNDEPVFAVKGVGVTSVSTVGSNSQHLILKLFENGKYYKAIFFNEGLLANEIVVGSSVDIAFTLKRNDFNGKTFVDMVVKDIIQK